MATRLQGSDLSKPWFAKKKVVGTSRRPNNRNMTHTTMKQNTLETLPKEHGKKNKKEKALPVSSIDQFLGFAKTAVPDEEELSRRRDADTIACGRKVKIICNDGKRRSAPAGVRSDIAEEDNQNNGETMLRSGGHASSPNSKRSVTHTEAEKEVEAYALDCRKKVIGDPTGHPEGIEVDRRSQSDSVQQYCNALNKNQRETPSAMGMYFDNEYQERHRRWIEFPKQGWHSQRSHVRESFPRSPRSQRWIHRCMEGNDNPGHDTSRSSVYGRDRQQNRRRHICSEYDEYSPRADQFEVGEEFRNFAKYSRRDHRQHLQYDSSSPESAFWRSKPLSVECCHGNQRYSTPMSSMSLPMTSTTANGTTENDWGHCIGGKEDSFGSIGPLDRTQRRCRQTAKKSEKAKRERAGKKAFYLTLDSDGKPYGSGKPAWIAEINKLAVGLDPSCTHVRKQTFEDVQTFKDRLNESFEYSGILNEDYLRGLMGKAVTKKRRELIALIMRNGKQPLHIDYKVWHRLQMLAVSKQWEERSEQGRHANACQKSIGRIGSIGENGVRQNLHLRLGRSPDPDEVEEEMHRNKGFGGRKQRMCAVDLEVEKNSIEVMNPEKDVESTAQAGHRSSPSIERSVGEMQKRQKSVRTIEDGIPSFSVGKGETTTAHSSHTLLETTNLSKDEYIQQLEAEIVRLQACEAKAFTGKSHMPRETHRHPLDNEIDSQ